MGNKRGPGPTWSNSRRGLGNPQGLPAGNPWISTIEGNAGANWMQVSRTHRATGLELLGRQVTMDFPWDFPWDFSTVRMTIKNNKKGMMGVHDPTKIYKMDTPWITSCMAFDP